MGETARGATGKILISIGDSVRPAHTEGNEELKAEQGQFREEAERENAELKARREEVLKNPQWTALNVRVLILPHLPEEKTQSGIILAGKEPPEQGRIAAIGPDVKDLQIGDEVLYSKWSGGTVFIDKIEMIFVNAKDIIAKRRTNELTTDSEVSGEEAGTRCETGTIRNSEVEYTTTAQDS